ncbi:MAG: glycosyltransferase [Deltaproteobacteria bacterium]|nr:glycosyltransferase [Deltaproteobacteria bacterium]
MYKYSILILAKDEEENLKILLPEVNRIMQTRADPYELVVIDGQSKDLSLAVAKDNGAEVCLQTAPGYAKAFAEGLSYCRGEWIIAIDADLSHPPNFIAAIIDLIESGKTYDLIIGSRYIVGGKADMPLSRQVLSRLLSIVFSTVLSLPVRDVSSGLRGYRASMVKKISLDGRHYDVLIELLVKMIKANAVVTEIPIDYAQRHKGASHVKLASFALAYLRSLIRLIAIRY